jgi:ATP-dependent DNA helicase DinG
LKNYNSDIESAFKRIGFKPRDNQVESINKIINAFLDDKFANVVLSAPTGFGKSVAAAIVAEVIAKIEGISTRKSLILMQNNILVNQYQNTFNNNEHFIQMRGASTYSCDAITALTEVTAEDCMKVVLTDKSFCDGCEFDYAKNQRDVVDHLITNYSYYFLSREINLIKPRHITIWDEAHTIADVFCNHNTINVSVAFMDYLKSDAQVTSVSMQHYDTIDQIQFRLKANGITEIDYLEVIDSLSEIYKEIKFNSDTAADELFSENNPELYIKYSRLSKKYGRLLATIDYIRNNEHIFQSDEGSFSVKPIFITQENFYGILNSSSKNLFMSGTVSKKYLAETIGLKEEDTCEIVLDPTFDVENKKFIFMKPTNVSNATLQDPDTIEYISKVSERIVNFHASFNDNGIILTPSFKLSEQIADHLRSNVNSSINIIEHTRGNKAEDYVNEFKECGKLSVLISPSIFEGVSLDGDMCRYQILVKAPYASLADKRIHYIMNYHKEIYELMTLMKIIQGAGRSVRSKDDYADTYALDYNIRRLFLNKNNVWQNEFKVVDIK